MHGRGANDLENGQHSIAFSSSRPKNKDERSDPIQEGSRRRRGGKKSKIRHKKKRGADNSDDSQGNYDIDEHGR